MITKERALFEMKIVLGKLRGNESDLVELEELIDFVGEQLGAVIPDPYDLGIMEYSGQN